MFDDLKKRSLAGVLALGLGITSFVGCNENVETRIGKSIYDDKYVTYMNDGINASMVLTDVYGEKIDTDSDVIFVIADKEIIDGRYFVLAMDSIGNIYEGYINQKYIDHFGERIDKDILAGISKEASIESCSLENIPGEVYLYGMKTDSEDSVIDRDNIDPNASPLAVRNSKDLDSEVITYIYPGDTFVLLPEDEDYYQGVLWYKVAAVKRNYSRTGDSFEIAEGYLTSRAIDMNDKYGYATYVRTNKPAKVKRLIK